MDGEEEVRHLGLAGWLAGTVDDKREHTECVLSSRDLSIDR